ncbi:MAG: aminoglycoside 6-N-acetyltransferase [Solirubrobacteraceae bacterium]|nr:aminoglycoside 6-N-acetyltransferase [Solirubrobacteraceae bacterium]
MGARPAVRRRSPHCRFSTCDALARAAGYGRRGAAAAPAATAAASMDSGSAEAIREIRRARTPHPRWDADPTRQARAAIESSTSTVEGDTRAPDPPPSSSSRSGCSWPTPEARACLQRRRRRPPGRASLPGVGLDRVRPLQRSRFALLARWLAEPLVARWCNHETSAAVIEREFGPSVPYGWISEANGLAPKPEFCIRTTGRQPASAVPAATAHGVFLARFPSRALDRPPPAAARARRTESPGRDRARAA